MRGDGLLGDEHIVGAGHEEQVVAGHVADVAEAVDLGVRIGPHVGLDHIPGVFVEHQSGHDDLGFSGRHGVRLGLHLGTPL